MKWIVWPSFVLYISTFTFNLGKRSYFVFTIVTQREKKERDVYEKFLTKCLCVNIFRNLIIKLFVEIYARNLFFCVWIV